MSAPGSVSSLVELPSVVQGALGFYALATALGYGDECVQVTVPVLSPASERPYAPIYAQDGPVAFAGLVVATMGMCVRSVSLSRTRGP